EVYLHDGRIGIDNNPVENAIRPTAIGKKNWLFIGEARAGQRSAILYTLIESCRTHRIDPFEYLRTILTLLPTLTTGQIKDIIPAAWARNKQGGRRSAA
ncbi:MAG: transposase, partial [Verrucomicrobiota bacterium]